MPTVDSFRRAFPQAVPLVYFSGFGHLLPELLLRTEQDMCASTVFDSWQATDLSHGED